MIITINGLSPNYQSENVCILSIVHERKTEEKEPYYQSHFVELLPASAPFIMVVKKICNILNDVNRGFEANNRHEVFKKRLNNKII